MQKGVNGYKILGVLIVFGSLREMFSIYSDYRSGKLGFWPFGAELACLAFCLLGIYLYRKGGRSKHRL